MTRKIPEGYQTLTPSLTVTGAAQAIELYKKAFGARETYRIEMPGTGKIMHACIMIGDSKVFINDADPAIGCMAPSSSAFYMYTNDVDATFKQAKAAGMEEISAPKDMFWGDRTGTLKGPFGITWTLATHVRDVSAEEMEEGRKKFGKAA